MFESKKKILKLKKKKEDKRPLHAGAIMGVLEINMKDKKLDDSHIEEKLAIPIVTPQCYFLTIDVI